MEDDGREVAGLYGLERGVDGELELRGRRLRGARSGGEGQEGKQGRGEEGSHARTALADGISLLDKPLK
jgi:hypothetical protein